MALGPVNNSPSFAPPQTTASTGPVRLGVDGKSKPDDIGKALDEKFHLKAEGAETGAGAGFARVLGSIQSSSSRTAVLNNVEKKVNEFMNKSPAPSNEQIATFAKAQLTSQTLMYKHLEDSISKMAQDSISRIKDTFSDS